MLLLRLYHACYCPILEGQQTSRRFSPLSPLAWERGRGGGVPIKRNTLLYKHALSTQHSVLSTSLSVSCRCGTYGSRGAILFSQHWVAQSCLILTVIGRLALA